jgi:hypothetical protein
MAEPFVSSLDFEIARLEQAIERVPEYVQLQGLKRIRALYPQGGSPIPNIADEPTEIHKVGRKMAPERARALNLISSFLDIQKSPVKTADLLVVLQQNGIDLGGAEPVNTLSALLSTSGQFQAYGRSGWRLIRKDAKPAVPELLATQAAPLPHQDTPTPDEDWLSPGAESNFKRRI